LLEAEVAHKFLAALLNHKEVRCLLSDEQLTQWTVLAWEGQRDQFPLAKWALSVDTCCLRGQTRTAAAISGLPIGYPGKEVSHAVNITDEVNRIHN
jgi:hypothetical protein